MTVLESLVALVILGLAAVGFLELFQRASVATRDTAAWSHAVRVAELTMEQAVLMPTPRRDTVSGLHRRVELRPWGPRVQELVVSVDVAPPTGATVTVHRLVAAP
ncbi:MAG: type II secretion system protein [Gemmatimonadota bacterium]